MRPMRLNASSPGPSVPQLAAIEWSLVSRHPSKGLHQPCPKLGTALRIQFDTLEGTQIAVAAWTRWRPQLTLLLLLAAIALAGLGVREWRAGFPDAAERLDRFDRED